MYIIIWLVFGALVGWVASILMKKNASMGLISNIIIGLLGSALGMWLMDLLEFGRPNSLTILGFIVSVGGASILIALFNALKRR